MRSFLLVAALLVLPASAASQDVLSWTGASRSSKAVRMMSHAERADYRDLACNSSHVRLDGDWAIVAPDGRTALYSERWPTHVKRLDGLARDVTVGDTVPTVDLVPSHCGIIRTKRQYAGEVVVAKAVHARDHPGTRANRAKREAAKNTPPSGRDPLVRRPLLFGNYWEMKVGGTWRQMDRRSSWQLNTRCPDYPRGDEVRLSWLERACPR